MSKRDVVALVVLAAGLLVVGLGCVVTYGVLREYADVCGETSPLEQVWLGGAGLGPPVAVVAVVLAIVVATVARRRGVRVAAVGLVVLALVGVTASGAAGVAGKKAAYEDDPATYGTCGGYKLIDRPSPHRDVRQSAARRQVTLRSGRAVDPAIPMTVMWW